MDVRTYFRKYPGTYPYYVRTYMKTVFYGEKMGSSYETSLVLGKAREGKGLWFVC